MKTIIILLFFVSVSLDTLAQSKNVLDSLIIQSLECFFHRFDNCENEPIRNRYTNRVKYVCKDGLPLSLYTGKYSDYYFHDKDFGTIRKLEKSKSEGISSVYVELKLYGDTIVIPIRDVSISYKSKRRGLVLLSDGDEYRFKYDIEHGKWLMVPLKRNW